MKKLLASVALALIGVQAAFSQGQVNFANSTATFGNDGIDRFVYSGSVGGTKMSGTNFVAAIYWGTSADSLNNFAVRTLTDTTLPSAVGAFRVSTSASIGTWVGGARFFIGANIGDTVQLQIRVWDITRFATYADALGQGGLTGHSDPFPFLIPASTDTAGLAMRNLRAFAVGVPEPSTIALGVLGLGSLLLFRRKKA
jgi:hypothetical protein